MTAKLAMIAGLVLLLLAQGWGGIAVWRAQSPRVPGAQEKQPAAAKPAPPTPGRVSLQPTAPASPPDFNQGYLFNAERSLAADGGKGPKAQNAVNVGWDKVQYNGSIITGSETKALLSYPQGGPQAGGGLAPGGTLGAQGFLRVVVGDTVNGYKVTEILPGRIVFAKGDQKISKSLYEKGKQRLQAQAAASPAPAAEQPQGALGVAAPPTAAKPAEATPAPRKRLEPQQESGERRPSTPRKRPLPPKDSPAPDAKNVLQMLIERQRQLNQSRSPEEKKFTP